MNPGDSSESEGEEDEDAGKKDKNKIPVVVGLGIKGVFMIIKDIWKTNPELCLRALTEFSAILCGQNPAGLKNEPTETTSEWVCLFNEWAWSMNAFISRCSV